MHEYFADNPDLESVMGDSTVVRAHACAAGACQPKKARKMAEAVDGEDVETAKNEAVVEDKAVGEALGRSKGGFGTKIHLLVDALGRPLRFIVTGGPEADVNQAIPLLQGFSAHYGIFDKAYDADYGVEFMKGADMIPVIPPKKNRKEPRDYDRHLYKERHLIEVCIGKLKQFRRVFSRFDKLARNYLSFVQFAAALIWCR